MITPLYLPCVIIAGNVIIAQEVNDMYFDTHAHYDSGAFNADRYEILGSMPASNVGLIVDPGCDLESSKAAIALAERFDFVYAAVG